MFVATKIILVAGPANDNRGGYSQTTGSMGTPYLTERDFPGHASTLPFRVRTQGMGVGVGWRRERAMCSHYLWIVCPVCLPRFD